MGFYEKDWPGKPSFSLSSHHINQGHTLSTCFTTVDVDLDHLAEIVLPRLIHCKVLFPLLSCTFWRKWPCSPHTSEVEVMHIFLEGRVATYYFKFCCMGDLYIFLHLLIYSIIYLHYHGLMNIYFILWVITNTTFCSNCSSFGQGVPSISSCISLTYLCHCVYVVMAAVVVVVVCVCVLST